MCIENAQPLNHGITHHCRLEHVSTAWYTLLTRSDIIRMSQPVWMSLSLSFLSLSLSSCLCSVSIYSPLLCCTSPQLPVFCSFGLFSLYHPPKPPPQPLVPPSLLPAIPPSVADCSRIRASGRVWAELSQHLTREGRRFTEWRDAWRKTTVLHLLPLSPAIHSLPVWHLLTPVLHLFTRTFPLKINTGCSLLTWYQCCHILNLLF